MSHTDDLVAALQAIAALRAERLEWRGALGSAEHRIAELLERVVELEENNLEASDGWKATEKRLAEAERLLREWLDCEHPERSFPQAETRAFLANAKDTAGDTAKETK